jgi:hypothetical protein
VPPRAPIVHFVMLFLGLAFALLALAAAAVRTTGRRERDRFIKDLELVRAETMIDKGAYKSMR